MPIKFHCEHCGKTISAPDTAGGKHGRCPACKEVVYIPSAETEDLPLAPVDEAAEQRRRRLVEETLAKEHDLLMAQGHREKPAEGEDTSDLDGNHGEGGLPPSVLANSMLADDVGPKDLVIAYLRNMASGELDEADAAVKRLRADSRAALAAISQIQSDPVRDRRIANLPPPVVSGFLKQLQAAVK
jgi:hypothetical protein